MRRDISLVVKERIYQTAFVFLVLFASVVIFNDVTKSLARASYRKVAREVTAPGRPALAPPAAQTAIFA